MVHFLQGNLLLATPVPPQAGKKGRAREPKFARMDSARERERERARERERDAHYPYTILYILIYLCIYICTDIYPNLNRLFHVDPLLILLGESSPLESG